MRPNESSSDRLRGATITYKSGDFGPGKLTIEIPVDTPAPRAHLIHAAAKQRKNDSAHAIAWSVDSVAERHLDDTTNTTAYIRNDAQQIQAVAYVGQIPPLTATPPLSAAQEALLPHLTHTVRDVLPSQLRPYADDIAQLAAQAIPSEADILRAYQRTSVTEVVKDLDSYDEPMEPDTSVQEFLTALSFPTHPQTALRYHQGTPSASSNQTKNPHISTHLER